MDCSMIEMVSHILDGNVIGYENRISGKGITDSWLLRKECIGILCIE